MDLIGLDWIGLDWTGLKEAFLEQSILTTVTFVEGRGQSQLGMNSGRCRPIDAGPLPAKTMLHADKSHRGCFGSIGVFPLAVSLQTNGVRSGGLRGPCDGGV